MKVRSSLTTTNYSRQYPFTINNKNRHQYTKVTTPNGDVYMRKNRTDTIITVDINGIIIDVKGINPKNNKIGDDIYKPNIS